MLAATGISAALAMNAVASSGNSAPASSSGQKRCGKEAWRSRAPAGLAAPDIDQAAAAERLRERCIDQVDVEAPGAHHLGGGGVFRELRGQRADAAGGFEIGAPPQHGLALGKTAAERIGEILPARLIGVQESAFEPGPEIPRP
jgi:hypothetical protein